MTTYKLSVWYAASDEDEPQTHAGLTAEQVDYSIRPEVGFMHDLIALKGRGVRKLTIEVEP